MPGHPAAGIRDIHGGQSGFQCRLASSKIMIQPDYKLRRAVCPDGPSAEADVRFGILPAQPLSRE